MNLRDLILSANDIKTEAVTVPEWGTTVYLKVMDANQRLQWLLGEHDDEGNRIVQDRFARLLVYCLCDEAGKLVFTPDDIPALSAKHGDVLFGLFLKAKNLNGLSPAGKAVDDAEKN